jgi:hypothetical protein
MTWTLEGTIVQFTKAQWMQNEKKRNLFLVIKVHKLFFLKITLIHYFKLFFQATRDEVGHYGTLGTSKG